jgi:CRP-like cAMP-binding protein
MSVRRPPRHLQQLRLFADCRNSQLDQASSLMTGITVPAGTVLTAERTPGRQFMIIGEGQVSVTQGSGSYEHQLAVLGAGDFVGEMSLLNRTRQTATSTAITPVQLYVCNPAEFVGLMRLDTSVATQIADTAADRQRANGLAA